MPMCICSLLTKSTNFTSQEANLSSEVFFSGDSFVLKVDMAEVETLVGTILQVLFDKFASREILDLLGLRDFTAELLERLKSALLTVKAVLPDAEKQIASALGKQWLDEVKDAVYDAEDLLDEIATETLRRKLETGSGEQDSATAIMFNIESNLAKLVSRLEAVTEQKDIFSLKEGTPNKTIVRLPTTSLVDESEVFGRKDDVKRILEFLLSDLPHEIYVPIVAIVGMPGIGKTTLAQVLYNNKQVEKNFVIRAWVYVSEEIDVFNVTKTIYESVALSESNATDLNILQVKLQEEIRGKKFLLVLDDVWNENFATWDFLQKPFKAAAAGSRIIITTRSHNVASTMGAAITHVLPQLSNTDCWSLFARYAFRNRNTQDFLDLKQIGEKVVKKCSGLPLAAKTLGALLLSKPENGEWVNVLNSKVWNLPNDNNSILPALKLSYCYLPRHLKRCFAYCSIFPKGYEIDKENLILLWMAERLLLQTESNMKRPEEIGKEYLHELVSRSFFLQSGQDKSSLKMHDLFHDLAQSVAGEFCFTFEDADGYEVTEKVRYFSYLADQYGVFEKFDSFQNARRLRTFMPLKSPTSKAAKFLSATVLGSLFRTLKCLRVLSLSPYKVSSLDDASVGCLKHLRYLDLSHTLIRKLPESACSLYNLETLLLLRCCNLSILPEKMHKLVNLRHLDIRQTKLKKMPPDFGSLKSLQLLTNFVVGTSGSKIGELKELLNLQGELSISGLQNVTNATDASAANLKAKKHLRELVLHWKSASDNTENETLVLDKLQPHESLKKLQIENYGGTRFPTWLGDDSLSNLACLCLNNCMNCDVLPSFGQLSSLKELHIANMERIQIVGPEFCGNVSSSFRSLEILKFENMLNWENWSFSVASEEQLPCIKELHLVNCPKLTGHLPQHLPSLKLLHICDCADMTFQNEDREEQYTKLSYLDIKNSCKSLISFRLDCFTKLKDLCIEKCSNLEVLDISSSGEFEVLQSLEIRDCPNLKFSSGTPLHAPKLELLSLTECSSLTSMPEQMDRFTSLRKLKICRCPELASLPAGGLPTQLQSLSIDNCEKLTPRHDWGLQHMTALASFEIDGGCSGLESFPEDGLLPATITSLHITGLLDIKTLNYKGLQHLTSLQTLYVSNCEKLENIRKDMLPAPCTLYTDQ